MKRSRTGKLDIHAVLMRLVCVLLMMVLVTTGMVSGQLARYITSAAGTDYARVAEFDITQTGTLTESFTLPIAPGGSIQRAVTVRNSSEVAVNYRIAVSNPEDNLPLEFSAVDSGNTPKEKVRAGAACMADYILSYTFYVHSSIPEAEANGIAANLHAMLYNPVRLLLLS